MVRDNRTGQMMKMIGLTAALLLGVFALCFLLIWNADKDVCAPIVIGTVMREGC